LRDRADAPAVQEFFRSTFGRAPQLVASAPGRVNLIGEHTDYNGGFVLPMAIPQRTYVALARRGDTRVAAASRDLPRGAHVETFELGRETRVNGWLDYVQGCTEALAADGHPLGGFDVAIVSSVPLGSGLSSSAALEVAVLRGLRELFGLALGDVRLAQLGQRAENDFVGAPVGLMDQMAASLADERTALFLDTRSVQYETVPLPPGAGLVVINSGVAHNHASGDYRTRRAECERAAGLLGVALLRELGTDDLDRVRDLPEPLNRRARHVITENQRVLDAIAAMRNADLPRLGRLFHDSHVSQRDDYEVSVPEIDLLVSLAMDDPRVFGARLTGGGFGGSIVALVGEADAVEVSRAVAFAYAAQSGREPTVLVPHLD
jgi:galactokinase